MELYSTDIIEFMFFADEAWMSMPCNRDHRANGMQFASLPIPDRQVPASESEVSATLDRVGADLSAGRNVVIHCRQGIGRTGLIAACLLVTRGVSPGSAVDALSAARGVQVPETLDQRQWIDHYAAVLAHPK